MSFMILGKSTYFVLSTVFILFDNEWNKAKRDDIGIRGLKLQTRIRLEEDVV